MSTITEQDSLTTLRPVGSGWKLQGRVISLQHPASVAALKISKKEHGTSVGRRRQCISLDENDISHVRSRKRLLHSSSAQVPSSSSDTSAHLPAYHAPKAVRPPFHPPERVKTPDGIPTWRGQQLTAAAAQQLTPRPNNASLLQQLRFRGSRVFRHVFGPPGSWTAIQARPWRPPVSGHSLPRFAELELHPFSSASALHVAETGAQDVDNGLNGSPEQHHTEHATQPGMKANLDVVWTSDRRVLSPSQRALYAANGNAVPVSATRARRCSQASNTSRSICASENRIRSPILDHGLDSSNPIDTLTMRTVDLIEQFPAPPVSQIEDARPHIGTRKSLLSIFPHFMTTARSPNERDSMQSCNVVTDRLQKKSRVKTALSNSQTNMNGRRQSIAAVDEDLSAHDPGAFRNHCGRTASGEDDTHSPSVRGESISRHRHSGTPVYNSGSASLRSLDMRDEAASVPSPTPPHRPMSAMTGNTRYFSAGSTAIVSQIARQSSSSREEQERRAVTNGALRFAQRNVTQGHPASPARNPVRSNDENNFPITPVTVTQAGKEQCPHRSNVIARQRYDLDGPSPPTVTSPTPSAPLGPVATDFADPTAPPPAGTNDDEWLRQYHISQRHYGTWGTRMKSTKCWRCELESRREASQEALTKQFKVWRGWAHKTHESLRWTCLCRYAAYEDESDEDVGRTRERVRLGRMGGEL